MRLVVAVLLMLVIVSSVYVYSGDVYGYIVIRDIVGRIWTLGDVSRLYNTSYNGYNLGETFVLVLGGEKYFLKDMVEYDGMAAWRVRPGRYNYTLYWFGYMQNGTIDVAANTYTVLKLETAPFLPIDHVDSSDKTWIVSTNPIRLSYMYNSFKIWIMPGTDYITVQRLDPVSMSYVNNTFSVYINESYTYMFHLGQFGSYDYTESGGYWWFKWDLVHIHEEARLIRSGPVTIISYAVSITRNKEAYDAMDTLYTMLTRSALKIALTGTYTNIDLVNDARSLLDAAYDAFIAVWDPSGEGVTILFEIIAAPTTTIIVARSYQHRIWIDGFGNKHIEKTPIPLRSNNAVVYNNTAIQVYSVYGGFGETIVDQVHVLKAYLPADSSNHYSKTIQVVNGGYYKLYTYSSTSDSYYKATIPGGRHREIHGDISLIGGYVFVCYKISTDNGLYVSRTAKIVLNITFEDNGDADYYETMLNNYNVQYTRSGNTFIITLASASILNGQVLMWSDISRYTKYARSGSLGYLSVKTSIQYTITGGTTNKWLKLWDLHYMYIVYPRIEPITYKLYLNGYTHIGSAYAVRLALTAYKLNDTWYLPSYYVFSNPPKRRLILTYDVEIGNGTAGPTVNITYLLMDEEIMKTGEILHVNYTGYGDSSDPLKYYARIEFNPLLDPVFQDTILGFYDIYHMSFLHLDIRALMTGVPLYREYGIYIWSWPEQRYIVVYDENYVNKLIEATGIQGISDRLEQQWNNIAKQLGLVADTLNKIIGNIADAWSWLNNNWKWLLLGLGLFLVLVLLLLAGVGGRGRVVVVPAR